jgi:CheY-like chemotaxis protein
MGVRVLVAEDEALIALSLADLLEAEGHEVVLAPDGADALDAALRLGDALDVLVTDLNMPRLGGEDLIRELRAERPGLPVVVVTGSAPGGGDRLGPVRGRRRVAAPRGRTRYAPVAAEARRLGGTGDGAAAGGQRGRRGRSDAALGARQLSAGQRARKRAKARSRSRANSTALPSRSTW